MITPSRCTPGGAPRTLAAVQGAAWFTSAVRWVRGPPVARGPQWPHPQVPRRAKVWVATWGFLLGLQSMFVDDIQRPWGIVLREKKRNRSHHSRWGFPVHLSCLRVGVEHRAWELGFKSWLQLFFHWARCFSFASPGGWLYWHCLPWWGCWDRKMI